MPVTKSEMMFFAAGAAVGAALGANLPLLKEKLGPMLAKTLLRVIPMTTAVVFRALICHPATKSRERSEIHHGPRHPVSCSWSDPT